MAKCRLPGDGEIFGEEQRMRFGTFSYNQARPWVSERQSFEELLEQIQLTERLGFGEAWLTCSALAA